MIKKYVVVFVLASVLFACVNDVSPVVDAADVSAFIYTNYADDARQIYIREINSNVNHPEYNSAVLDTAAVNKILMALQAVYTLKSAETDSIFNHYQLHVRQCYSLQAVSLTVKPTATEIVNLINGAALTGSLKLDSMLSSYKFDSVRLAHNYPANPWISIRTKSYYNLIPIIESLKTLPFVLDAKNDAGCMVDGNDISVTREGDNITHVDFGLGVGDCMAGCPYKIHWVFSVDGTMAKFEKRFEGI